MPLALIVLTTVLAHAGFNGSRLTMSLDALSRGASPLTVGVIMSLFAALPMVFGVAAGRLVDRIGVRWPMIASVGVLASMVALPGIVPGIATLYVAAAAVGTSFMLFQICVQHAVGNGSSDSARKTNFGYLALGFSISNFFGPTFAGFAIDTVGHRVTFLLLSLFSATSFLTLLARRKSFTHTPGAARPAVRPNAFELMRDPELRRVFFVTAILSSAWDLFVFVMPIYGTAIGLNASTIGLILGSFALATILVRLALPWISRHLADWTMITATMCIACVAYALFPMVQTVPLLASIAFLLGIGLGATQPSVMNLIYAKAPGGRAAEALGVRTVVLNASHTFLPLMFGGVGAALGMMPVFLSMSTALASGAWLSNKRRLIERGV